MSKKWPEDLVVVVSRAVSSDKGRRREMGKASEPVQEREGKFRRRRTLQWQQSGSGRGGLCSRKAVGDGCGCDDDSGGRR